VKPLADQLGCDFLIDCDVSDMANLDQAFATLAARWPTIDFIVHAIGYTNKEALRGAYADVGLEDFLMTMNISVYSFTAVAKRAAAMMAPYDPETGQGGGAMLTLSYYGAEKVIPHYNVMGVAKSALETSVKYLANDYGPQGIRVNAICRHSGGGRSAGARFLWRASRPRRIAQARRHGGARGLLVCAWRPAIASGGRGRFPACQKSACRARHRRARRVARTGRGAWSSDEG
jgi:NAD(P)-dependent dehydrogenase (short-subunit alcohol dehydrogenase family)